MIARSMGEGNNPYTVNVVSFSGHGIHFDGDAIAVIPQMNGGTGEARFINLSAYARKFAGQKYTLTVFICSMCRIELKHEQKEAVYHSGKNNPCCLQKDAAKVQENENQAEIRED